MDEKLKLKFFENELKLISSDEIRKMCKWFITKIPDYIFEVPASSSGKYHPEKARGNHGLVYHIKLAVNIANHLFETINVFECPDFRDKAIMALILHDSAKSGIINSGHTVKYHPMIASNYIKALFYEEYVNYINNPRTIRYLEQVIIDVTKAIESHMGKWNCDVMPVPKDTISLLVHQADYLASKLHVLDIDYS